MGCVAVSMSDKEKPTVTVVLPVRNEVQFVSRAIKNFLNNDYPPERMEIIAVDGCSDDGTKEVIENLSRTDGRIIVIENRDRITPVAMNLGVKAAKGKYILVAGAHNEYSQDYLKSCVEVIERTGAGCVGGYMETLPGGTGLVAGAISCATSSPFGVGGAKFRTGGDIEQEVDALGVSFIKKEVFEKVGMYNPLLVRNQDIEFSSRVRKAGYKIIVSPKIKLKYYNRGTFAGLRRQAFSNGKWNAYTLWVAGGGLRLRHLIPAAFVLSLTGLLVLALLVKGVFVWLLCGYLGLYLAAGSFEALRTSCRAHKIVLLPLILLSFLQMHLWYGFGTILGAAVVPFKFHRRAISLAKTEDSGR